MAAGLSKLCQAKGTKTEVYKPHKARLVNPGGQIHQALFPGHGRRGNGSNRESNVDGFGVFPDSYGMLS